MNKNVFNSHKIFLLVGMLSMCGCAATTKVMVPVTRPAEIDLRGIDKIAIGEIQGKGGREIEDLLTTRLFESGKFEVLDRQNLERLMKEHRLKFTGIIDSSTAVKLGKMIGAATLVFGNVPMHKADNKVTYSAWKDREGGSHRTYYNTVTAKVKASFKVVGLRTGKIVAAKTIYETVERQNKTNDAVPEAPDADEALNDATNKVVERFMKMICPYQDYVAIEFERKKELPELAEGIIYARTGEWDLAEKKFKQAVDKMPTSPEAHYNLGVAYEHQYKFRKAEEALREAIRLSTIQSSSGGLAGFTESLKKSSEKYSREIENVKRLENEWKKLNEQDLLK
ncbi:MAG: tetratricopeptide repeat protein [Proteobacteria bacterium]|nr:tetratricopeptide repeat protein [Pseudomonadota bacterium]MBU4259832.1 tetratricopeptide repeat protein [Pseudomonadota bacterium]MBU4287756.1 tetratricopeptide repeat protein [Pseudomonadota bacterium]MBU4414332.1 tetratricopeptide repeat protein [Pseudomonadota bacterium]MCG2756832.1 DUF6340 family protein [Desulfobacteraceae bacterium]